MNFQPGDVVQLKSGGPKMTVESLDQPKGEAYCSWFEGGKKQGSWIKMPALMKVAQ